MNSNLNIHDDLSAVKGIGPARAKWLRDNFGVKTYQELANLSISQIETKLKVEGKIVARKDIESWISQARDLHAKSGASKQINEGSAQDVLEKKLNSAGHKDGWEPFASFLVYFQTREVEKGEIAYQTLVHHLEEDHDISWPGIEADGLSVWMLEQISEYIDLHQGEVVGESPEESQETISLPETLIQEVRIYQPSKSEAPTHSIKAGQLFTGELHHDQLFHVGVDFSLSSEVGADGVEKGITCFARCYQYNTSTHKSSLLAETSPLPLETSKLNYTYNLPEVSLPRGDYRLVVMITNSQTDRLMPDFLELTSIRVD